MDLKELGRLLNDIKQSDVLALENILLNRDRIYLIGNGGSNSICSHLAQDYTKALNLPSVSFSDPSRLTCYINDYGRDKAYAKFIEHFASSNSLCILISSSGNSQNILETAEYCTNNNVDFIILTGFEKNNKLRSKYAAKALLEYYVPSSDYGIVENLHAIFLHSVI